MAKARGGVTSLGTVGAFIKGRACSDTLFHVINRAYGQRMKLEEQAAMPFAGGIMQHGYQCGMIWGAAMAAGAQAYRMLGAGAEAETRAILASGRVVDSFRACNGHVDCVEITELDSSSSVAQMVYYFVVKGGTVHCFRMSGRYGPVAFREVDAALNAAPAEVPEPPVSCAALLLRKAGASELHATMAAGLAGGIGLSGGGCGALGAAVWLIAMRSKQERGKIVFKDKKAREAIERFLKRSDYEMTCAEIVGRRFDGVADHAAYLREGGCAAIIEELAAAV